MNAQMKVIIGCWLTACIIAGCVIANATAPTVTSMLAKTSEYVRRMSVARSSPVRTIVPCCGIAYLEKPIHGAP
jgi:ABC-type thiamin/hydroxymethylpyrimidine transport system permease subunit